VQAVISYFLLCVISIVLICMSHIACSNSVLNITQDCQKVPLNCPTFWHSFPHALQLLHLVQITIERFKNVLSLWVVSVYLWWHRWLWNPWTVKVLTYSTLFFFIPPPPRSAPLTVFDVLLIFLLWNNITHISVLFLPHTVVDIHTGCFNENTWVDPKFSGLVLPSAQQLC